MKHGPTHVVQDLGTTASGETRAHRALTLREARQEIACIRPRVIMLSSLKKQPGSRMHAIHFTQPMHDAYGFVHGKTEKECSVQRREFLRQAGTTLALASTATLAGCAKQVMVPAPAAKPVVPLTARMASGVTELAPIKAQTDRITGVYVCSRPFRAAGPRIEMERMGHKTIVHNYGHGGSGWSLSWGSSTLALRMAQTTGVRELGVIGCGALGLTSALLAQQAGLSVRIYAKALPPDVFSMRATGLWTPDSRICDAQHAAAFGDRWEEMTRTSFARYQSMLGLPAIRLNGSKAITCPI
jgi:hypothetical protein